MNPSDFLLLGGAGFGLALGLVLYVRHGHRRLYRELRQLREATGQTPRQEDLSQLRAANVQELEAARAQAAQAVEQAQERVTDAVEHAQARVTAAVEHAQASVTEAVERAASPLLPALDARLLDLQTRLEARLQSQLQDGLAPGQAQVVGIADRLQALSASLTDVEGRLGAQQAATSEALEQARVALEAVIVGSAERMDASSAAREAQLRAQLAVRHAEFETAHQAAQQALRTALEQPQFELRHALQDLRQRTDSQLQALADALESVRGEQAAQAGQANEAAQTLQAALASRPALPAPSAGLNAEALKPLHRLQIDLEFVKNRMSSYLGEGMGLTHLVDETPIYLNTADIGCPANFINGGRYEEEYLQVLASFCRPDTVFLDIGANLGVFSLRLAPYLREGRIMAFEPNARIRELFGRSVHLNGLRERIEIFECGASDETAELVLEVPQGHAGGGHVEPARPGDTRARIHVRPLDEVLHELPAFHVAKIDVEGHELHALRGMQRLLARSPQAVVLFEKLVPRAGLEAPLMELFSSHGMQVWRIDGVRIELVDLASFEQATAYFLAARPATVGQELDRGFVCIRPGHLFKQLAHERGGSLVPAAGPHGEGALLFHGPYWYLPRGVYRVQVQGALHRPVQFQVTEKYGYSVTQAVLQGVSPQFDFVAERDLTHFELVGRATGADPAFEIESLRVTRIG